MKIATEADAKLARNLAKRLKDEYDELIRVASLRKTALDHVAAALWRYEHANFSAAPAQSTR